MRVHELSKKIKIPTKQLLTMLQEAGFDVKSHMSALTDEELTFLTNEIEKKSSKALEVNPVKQKEMQKDMQIQKEKHAIKKIIPQEPHSIDTAKTGVNVSIPQPPPTLSTGESEKADAKTVPNFVIQPMMVIQFAEKTGKLVNDVILTLLKWRIVTTKNQVIGADVVARLVEHYGIKIEKNISVPETKEHGIKRIVATGKNLKERLPVVVVLGHVDHGKTTLLDFIRKTRVAAREKGGITQHLGAYEATTEQGNIVFLDTPGHEAFSKIRQRGVHVADIAILVVAADDGIMPQTIEAIKHIKAMNIPVIVAINKIDKVDEARIEIIKRQLAQYDLVCEEWGGSVICVPISAKTGRGINQLLEMIILQSQMMELSADANSPARGYLLEAKMEKGRGIVATLLCQQGTANVGDYFICGKTAGHITSLVDSYGKRLTSARPSIPVQVSGFEALPEVADLFAVVSKQEYLKIRANQDRKQISTRKGLRKENNINIIIKTDTNSSKEALIEAIERVSKGFEIGINIVYVGIGDINESDIELAFNTESEIVGLHIKAENNAIILAQKRGVNIQSYDIIYKLLESLTAQVKREQKVEMVQTKIGEAVVRRVFDIPNIGVVAGCYVRDGRFTKDGYLVIWRGKQKVGEGKIISLQREKKSVKEVHAGFECGFVVQDMRDWAVDDRVECFIEIPKK